MRRILESEIFDAVLKLVVAASAALGFPFLLERILGTSELVRWIGVGGGILVGGISALVFCSAAEEEREKSYEYTERKKAEAQRDYLEHELHRALRLMSDEQRSTFDKEGLVD